MAMTRVMSTRFVDVMTHPTARDVILQCLILFPRQPNEVLYEKVILHFQDLAIHEVGCRSLYDCITLIRRDQRVRLINKITNVSDNLSYDPYGNYVVQHLLGLINKNITKKIMHRLQNQFMGLSVRKGGCLMVEIGMATGRFGAGLDGPETRPARSFPDPRPAPPRTFMCLARPPRPATKFVGAGQTR
ncbi:UNVERIFIED_CONTAM: hypothetical protein Slati_0513600 [Sesamum latifolium]|uniref:PUM-HD domain-containing protein n=1 Tax=Sesamum latifolium TaxID=2727402 RepID=A0AAW2XZV2_9LAMI